MPDSIASRLGAHQRGQVGEDAAYDGLLLAHGHEELIVELDREQRLDEEGLTGDRAVLYDAPHAADRGGADGYDEAIVAQRYVAVGDDVRHAAPGDQILEAPGEGIAQAADGGAHGRQLVARFVEDDALVVQRPRQGRLQSGEGGERRGKVRQRRAPRARGGGKRRRARARTATPCALRPGICRRGRIPRAPPSAGGYARRGRSAGADRRAPRGAGSTARCARRRAPQPPCRRWAAGLGRPPCPPSRRRSPPVARGRAGAPEHRDRAGASHPEYSDRPGSRPDEDRPGPDSLARRAAAETRLTCLRRPVEFARSPRSPG